MSGQGLYKIVLVTTCLGRCFPDVLESRLLGGTLCRTRSRQSGKSQVEFKWKSKELLTGVRWNSGKPLGNGSCKRQWPGDSLKVIRELTFKDMAIVWREHDWLATQELQDGQKTTRCPQLPSPLSLTLGEMRTEDRTIPKGVEPRLREQDERFQDTYKCIYLHHLYLVLFHWSSGGFPILVQDSHSHILKQFHSCIYKDIYVPVFIHPKSLVQELIS